MSASKKATLPMKEVDLSHLSFDSTNKTDYQVKEARIRATEVYLTSALLVEMEETWGGSFAAVKTITDKATQKVYVFPSSLKESDLVPVRKSETLSSATFSFFIPMQILNLKLRKDRQIVVVPEAVPVKGLTEAYCFSLAGVRATKRPRVPEDEATPEVKPVAETKLAPEGKPAKAEAEPKGSKGSPAAAGAQSKV